MAKLCLKSRSVIFRHFFPSLTLHVFDKGCTKHGVYGSNCALPCPEKCKDEQCHLLNGNCFACELGWTGAFCNASMNMIRTRCSFKELSNILIISL